MECIGIWGGWSEGAVDLASFKRSSKLTLLVGICSTMERLNNNAWSNENYTAPARKEKLIALRLHSREVCSFKHMRAHAHTHGRAGKHFYTHTDTQVHVEPWLWAEPGLRTECATVCVCVCVCICVWTCSSPVLCSGEKNRAWATFQPCLPGRETVFSIPLPAYQARCIPEHTHTHTFRQATHNSATHIYAQSQIQRVLACAFVPMCAYKHL